MKKVCRVCEVFQLEPGNSNVEELKDFLKDTICEYVDGRTTTEENDLVDSNFSAILVKKEYREIIKHGWRFLFDRNHPHSIHFIKFETARSTSEKPEYMVLSISNAFVENALIDYDDPTFEFGTYDGFAPYLSNDSEYVTARYIEETKQYEVYSRKEKAMKLYSKVEFEAMYKHIREFF